MTLQRPAEDEEVDSQSGGTAVGFEYELHIQQVRMMCRGSGYGVVVSIFVLYMYS